MSSYSPFGNYTDVSKLMFSAKTELELARQKESMRKEDRLWNPTRHSSAFPSVRRGNRGLSLSVVPGNSDHKVISTRARYRHVTGDSGRRPILPQRYCEHQCEHFGRSFHQLPEPEDISRRELSSSLYDNRPVFQSFDSLKDASFQSCMGSNVPDDLLECFQACNITDKPDPGNVERNGSSIGNVLDGEESLSSASSFGSVFFRPETQSADYLDREKHVSSAIAFRSSSFSRTGLRPTNDLDLEERLSSASKLGSAFHRPEPLPSDDLDHEELLSSAPDLDGEVHRYDSSGAMSAASMMSGLMERYVEVVVEQKMRERSTKSHPQTICVFCRRNGETREYYSTHVLKDTRGKVICPVLQKYVCPRCRATGDRAHTLRHCPLSERQESIVDTFNTPRTSNGFRKF